MQDNELKTKILEIKSDIKDLDEKIENQKLIQVHLKNQTAIIDIAKEIDALSFEKDEKLSLLENTSGILEEYKNKKKHFIENQGEFKNLLSKTFSDNYYTSLSNRVLEYNPVNSKGHKIPLEKKLSDEEQITRKDINRLWELPNEILKAIRAKDTNLSTELIKEEYKLKAKHFKDELEADTKAVWIKKQINGELRKFIKEIKVYFYGFTEEEASKPFDDRSGDSTLDKHKDHLIEFFEKLEDEPEPKPKFKNGWNTSEICKHLGLERRTYKRYIEANILPDLKGTHHKLNQYKKVLVKKGNRGVKADLNNKYSQFFAYSIEFTDLCKPNEIRYVLPYYKDNTQGISFNLNTKSGRWELMDSFGDKEIKLRKSKSEPKNKKDVLYIEDDPILRKGFDMLVGYFRKFETNHDAVDSIDISLEKIKKLKTKEEKQEYISKIVKDIQTFQHNTIQLNRIVETIPDMELQNEKELFNQVAELIENQLKDSAKK